jgi:cell division protein FtsW (lipid II flippase)
MTSSSRDPIASVLARIPWSIVALALIIPLIGVLNLSSAAKNFFVEDLWLRQLMWVGAAAVSAAAVAQLKSRTIEWMAWPLYLLTVVLLVAVLAVGTPIKGAQRWLDLGPINMQPSELAKISMMVIVAHVFSRIEAPRGLTLLMLLRPWNISRAFLIAVGAFGFAWKQTKKEGVVSWETMSSTALAVTDDVRLTMSTVVIGGGIAAAIWGIVGVLLFLQQKKKTWLDLIAPIDVVVVPFLLVLVEPDLGTASIVFAIAVSQVLFFGMRRRDLFFAVGFGLLSSVFAWKFVLHDYQRRRIEVFLDPEKDIQGSGYHAAQSIIAIGSGRMSGKGFTEGTQTQLSFLPENHTDFAFSVWSEEWGFAGASVLVILFFLLVASMLRAAHRATDRFAALVAAGAAAMIFWHAFINIGMVIGVLPVVGVTLPLVSYGGSSMITKGIAIGLAIHAFVHAKKG